MNRVLAKKHSIGDSIYLLINEDSYEVFASLIEYEKWNMDDDNQLEGELCGDSLTLRRYKHDRDVYLPVDITPHLFKSMCMQLFHLTGLASISIYSATDSEARRFLGMVFIEELRAPSAALPY